MQKSEFHSFYMDNYKLAEMVSKITVTDDTSANMVEQLDHISKLAPNKIIFKGKIKELMKV